MLTRDILDKQRWFVEHVRELMESGPADEELGNRLQRLGDELEEIERLVKRSRSKAAEGMWTIRGALRSMGAKVPPMPRPPTTAPEDRGAPGAVSIVYSDGAAGACVGCGEEVGVGPTGWVTEPEAGPVCDGCLRQRCGELALVLMVANYFRELVEMAEGSEEAEVVLAMLVSMLGAQVEREVLGGWPARGTMSEERLVGLLEEIGREGPATPRPS